jgi:hypothetical protein
VKEITSSGFKRVGEENLLQENYFVRFQRTGGKAGEEKPGARR